MSKHRGFPAAGSSLLPSTWFALVCFQIVSYMSDSRKATTEYASKREINPVLEMAIHYISGPC